MMSNAHDYAARVIWDGNTGSGTASYASYSRQYRVRVSGKHDLVGSADPAFRGEAGTHNPEDFFLISIAACHMLFYLSLCSRRQVRVLTYEDEVRGTLLLDAEGGGRFEEVTLSPRVMVDGEEHRALALQLHDTAHERCFIANSCSVRIRHAATVQSR